MPGASYRGCFANVAPNTPKSHRAISGFLMADVLERQTDRKAITVIFICRYGKLAR